MTDDLNDAIIAYTQDGGFMNLVYDVKKIDFDKKDDENELYNDEGNGEGSHKPGNNFVEDVLDKDDTAENWVIIGVQEEVIEPGTDPDEPGTDPDEPGTDPDEPGTDPEKPETGISDAGKTIINMSRANYKNAIYMDRLNKRLGEARYINGEEEQGMWVRIRHDYHVRAWL